MSMTTTTAAQAIRESVLAARLAPSVHNSQPWRFARSDTQVAVLSDAQRRLRVLDPTGRQMMISCGCAVFNVRAELAAHGWHPEISRLPGSPPEVVAEIRAAGPAQDGDQDVAALAPLVALRQTNRRRFAEESVPAELIQHLREAVARENAVLVEIDSDDDRMTVARLSQRADAMEMANPAYRAELRAWTSNDSERTDGVPARAVPHVDAGSEEDVPIRDFDTSGAGWLPTQTQSSRSQCLLLLCTAGDSPEQWIRAGEALERLWLEVTRHGYAMSLFTQVIEVPETRAELRRQLRLTTVPQILLRVGRAPATPGTPRRHLAELLIETGG